MKWEVEVEGDVWLGVWKFECGAVDNLVFGGWLGVICGMRGLQEGCHHKIDKIYPICFVRKNFCLAFNSNSLLFCYNLFLLLKYMYI